MHPTAHSRRLLLKTDLGPARLCPQPFRAPTSLGVKAQVLPEAPKALHDLPHPLPPLPLSSPCPLCSSHLGLVLAVPPRPGPAPAPGPLHTLCRLSRTFVLYICVVCFLSFFKVLLKCLLSEASPDGGRPEGEREDGPQGPQGPQGWAGALSPGASSAVVGEWSLIPLWRVGWNLPVGILPWTLPGDVTLLPLTVRSPPWREAWEPDPLVHIPAASFTSQGHPASASPSVRRVR